MAGLEAGLQVHGAKAQHRTLAKAVQHLQRGQLALLKTQLHGLQLPVLALGRGAHPLLAVGVGGVAQGKHAVQAAQVRRGGNQRRRGVAQHVLLAAHGGLVQVGVKQPQLLAIGHDGLRKRLGVLEAEAARALELERAAAGLAARGGLAVLFGPGHGLGEAGLALLRGAQEGGQVGQAVGVGGVRQHQQAPPAQRAAHQT